MSTEEKKSQPQSPVESSPSSSGPAYPRPAEDEKNKLSAGQKLILALFKLFQMVKIHQANNKLVIETIADFRQALHGICAQFDGANIRIHRGRFYLNHERLPFSSTMLITVNKMLEYLQKRDIQGLRIYEKEGLTDEDIVHFVKLLNQAEREKDPLAWIQVQLDVANYTWVELLADQDKKAYSGQDDLGLNFDDDDLNEDGGLEAGGAADGQGQGQGQEGQAERGSLGEETKSLMAGILADGLAAPREFLERKKLSGQNVGLAQATYSHVMASMARKTYAHALTSVLDMTGKQTLKKRVGIQKSKRVVQGMIEILTKDESILLGMSTIRNYDDYTYTHSVNVAILAMCLGRRLGLPRRMVEQLGLCGLFHDLGKVDVPINLITKKGALSNDEYEEIKKHSINSVRQIIRLNADHVLKSKLILPPFEHHLGIDLSGYPQTERRTPLSLLGRILAVADCYDAMTSSRSYRAVPISPDVALKIMLDDAGTKLDPLILKVFIRMIGVYPVGSLLILDSREVGLAASTPEDSDTGRPIVCLLIRDKSGKIKRSRFVDLSLRDEESGKFVRNIIQCLHPYKFGIQPADFLV